MRGGDSCSQITFNFFSLLEDVQHFFNIVDEVRSAQRLSETNFYLQKNVPVLQHITWHTK